MAFESQKVALKYFVISAIFFGLQVVVGLLLVSKYIWPDPLIGFLPFNTARAIHTNLLVVWMIFGFMGGTYYIVPEESGTELFSKKLANLQFYLLLLGGLVGIVGFLFGWTATPLRITRRIEMGHCDRGPDLYLQCFSHDDPDEEMDSDPRDAFGRHRHAGGHVALWNPFL
jgi:heme/copper-type cytochrome/quinol oxidase subunit 1